MKFRSAGAAITVSAAIALLLLLPGLAQSQALHPAAGQLTREVTALQLNSVGLSSESSMGDLTFGSLLPDPAMLNPAERYMLAGTVASNLADGRALSAWIADVEDFCLDYSIEFAELPASISRESVELLEADKEIDSEERSALLLNPFTARPARLDCKAFAAGDLYVRPLSRAEQLHFAGLDQSLREAWYGRPGETATELACPVLYVRAYGAKGVIYENFAWRTRALASDISEVISLLEPQRRYTSTNAAGPTEETPLPPVPAKPCRSRRG